MLRSLLALLVAAVALVALPAEAKPKLRVLYLDQSVGWRHVPVIRPEGGGLAPSELAMIAIGQESGAFDVQVTQDARELTPERLAQVDVLVFYTTGALPVSLQAWAAAQARIAAGKLGFVGLHSAADTGWPYAGPGEPYARFLNGQFAGHPWTEGTPIQLETHDPDHPTVAMWPVSVSYAEEIYQYSGFDPARARVLQSLDFAATPLKRPYAVPVTWVRKIGKGRLFFTNLGHTPSTWQDPRFRRQITEAVTWTAGRGRGEAAPDPRRQALWQIRSLLAYAPVAGRDDAAILQRLTRLGRADQAWLLATGARIAALRPLFPGKPEQDRAPFDAAHAAVLAEVLAKAG